MPVQLDCLRRCRGIVPPPPPPSARPMGRSAAGRRSTRLGEVWGSCPAFFLFTTVRLAVWAGLLLARTLSEVTRNTPIRPKGTYRVGMPSR